MTRTTVTSGLGFFSRLANIRLLAVAREARSVGESPTRVPVEPAIIEAHVDRHAESLDAVAGSEFVDDRIRLRG